MTLNVVQVKMYNHHMNQETIPDVSREESTTTGPINLNIDSTNLCQTDVETTGILTELTQQAQDLGFYDATDEARCKLCFAHFKPRSSKMSALKLLGYHVKATHGMSALQYTIEVLNDGSQPCCAADDCSQETRYVGFTFKKYCKDHSFMAEAEAGKIGGKLKRTWNKDQTKETHISLLKQSIRQSGEGNHFFGKKHSQKTLNQIASSKRLPFSTVIKSLEKSSPNCVMLSNANDYKTQNSLLEIHCNDCGTNTKVSYSNIERCWQCRTCFPTQSRQQLEVFEFVKSLGFDDAINNDRQTIKPLELDIWIPSKKLAIEYHGLHWHTTDTTSENTEKNDLADDDSAGEDDAFTNNRHRQKYEMCKAQGIRLIQLFSDEWINKRSVCESIISNALGVRPVKLNARDCVVEKVDVSVTKPFLNDNHLNGATRASMHYVLKHPKLGIVGCVTYRKPIQQQKYPGCHELARMAFKKFHSVRGGASKMLKHSQSDLILAGATGLLSYAELRYGEGGVYAACGFKQEGIANGNYWYTRDGVRYDRFKFRADKPNGLTEKQVVENAGVRRVEGCGNARFVKKFVNTGALTLPITNV